MKEADLTQEHKDFLTRITLLYQRGNELNASE